MTEPQVSRTTRDGWSASTLAWLAVAWLATRLWSAYASIRVARESLSKLIIAAYHLPDVVAACLIAGAAAGLLAAGRFTRDLSGRQRRTRRTVFGATGGLAVGVLVSVAVLTTYGTHAADLTLAGCTTIAAVLGGALAGAAPAQGGTIAIAVSLLAVALGAALNLTDGVTKGLFAGGHSAASTLTAASWHGLTESLIVGIAVGVAAHQLLRRGHGAPPAPEPQQPPQRPDAESPRPSGIGLLAHLATGAAPGLLLLLTEALTRLGGAQLLGLARQLSPADTIAIDYVAGARLDRALVVGFVGAIVALLAFGRSLPTRPRPEGIPGAPSADQSKMRSNSETSNHASS